MQKIIIIKHLKKILKMMRVIQNVILGAWVVFVLEWVLRLKDGNGCEFFSYLPQKTMEMEEN